MRFTINLVTRTHLDHQLLNRIAYGMIAILLLLTVWNVSRVSSNLGELSRLRTETSAIEQKLGARPNGISEADFSRQKTRVRFYNEIIERKSISWTGLLELFEGVTPDGISLSSVSQGKKQGEWKIEGRARTFSAVQNYLEKLEASKQFSNILLLSHQNMATGERVHGVQFSISFKVSEP